MRTRTGEELKQLRNQVGISQAKAASLGRISKRVWEQWEQNPDTSSSRRPSPMAFSLLEMYMLLKNNGIEYEPEE